MKLTGSGYRQIFSAPSGESMRQIPKTFSGARTCCGGAQISPADGMAKNVEFFVCLSVRHAFERQRLCVRFRHEGVGYRNDFDAVG